MKILLFGATGLVGDGVLRWLITSPSVDHVVAVSVEEEIKVCAARKSKSPWPGPDRFPICKRSKRFDTK